MKRIYFTRHGLSEMNKAGIRSGTTETPLAPEGREQAKLAGQAAKQLPIDLIVCSNMERAVETAEIIAAEIGYPLEDIRRSPLLVERNFGVLEGQPYAPDSDHDDIEGIETSDVLFERARSALTWIETLPGDTVLIVAHGAIGRALRHILHPEIPFIGAGHLPNATIVEL